MTERPRARSLPHPLTTATAAVALFLAVLALLTWQMRAGHDPALASAQPRPALVAQRPARRVLVRRVIRRVVITKVVHDDDAPSASVRSVPVAVQVPAAAAAPAAPVAAAAPAPAPPPPAPAPAPMVTRTS